jgi:glutamate--cysteine ligase catalytic subunit
LQVTFQARDIDESRYMYDQLAVLAPIMLALSAATPIFKGRLADTDARWDVIAASVDDRTPAERGEVAEEHVGAAANDAMAGRGIRRLAKSRYDSISCFIYDCQSVTGSDPSDRDPTNLNKYNDIPCEVDEELMVSPVPRQTQVGPPVSRRCLCLCPGPVRQEVVRGRGVDNALARHIGHLFVRDPLVIFNGSIDVDNTKTTEHFENIQSTNWQTVRWKPPPVRTNVSDPHIGWRTEFRSMEVQLTDFENAAFTVFVILLTRIILTFDLSLYMPLSKVDENMRRAHKRDSVLQEKFYFRKHLAPLQAHECDTSQDAAGFSACQQRGQNHESEEMTIAEILMGKGDYFLGLIPLCYMYLDYIGCDRETFRRVSLYLEYIRKRGTGETLTTAAWMRKFVAEHPEYKQDSVVTPGIAFDLMMECKRIGEGKKQCPDLLGNVMIDPIFAGEAYDVYLSGDKMGSTERSKLIKAYRSREPFHHRRPPTQPSPWKDHRADEFFDFFR